MSRGNRADYQALAEFRHQIRKFLHFSEAAARVHGLEPQQHQLLLIIKGLPAGCRPTIRVLAERLLLEHHSTVELVARMVKLGVIERDRNGPDRREVLVRLTQRGEELLGQLTATHREELRTAGPQLILALESLLGGTGA